MIDIYAALGQTQGRFINDHLLRYLYFGLPLASCEARLRYAPSPIIRSECELLAVSCPRFALRACLPDGSFFNLRRLPLLRETVDDWFEPQADSSVARPTDDRPAELLRRLIDIDGMCVADSYLMPPPWIDREYNTLRSTYAAAYGDNAMEGVPFLRHIPLGGGMCAQACAFMATAILHDYADRIPGIPEITVLAHSSSRTDHSLPISGLDARLMSAYFASVNLNATQLSPPTYGQAAPNFIRSLGLGACDIYDCATLECVLRSYLSSGMPVILFLDGPSFWSRVLPSNGIEPRFSSSARPESHAVLAVGCHDRMQHKFLINDPASFPFLASTSLDLHSSRRPGRRHAPIMPVTPGDVRWQLWDTVRSDSRECSLGLITTSVAAINNPQCFVSALVGSPSRRIPPGDFRLLDPQSTPEVRQHIYANMGLSSEAQECIERAIVESHISTWAWVQYCNRYSDEGACVLVWDATNPSRQLVRFTDEEIKQVLLFVAREVSSGDWRPIHHKVTNEVPCFANSASTTPRGDTWSMLRGASKGRRPLTVCAITSAFTRSLSQGMAHARWPERICDVEVYMLMQSDMEELRSEARRDGWRGRGRTSMEFLSEIVTDQRRQEAVATSICDSLDRQDRRCRAFATFFPTLCFPLLDFRGEMAAKALVCVQRIAERLRRISQGRHDANVIEIVGGSRVSGIWSAAPNPDASRPEHYARIEDKEVARSRIVRRLANVRRELEEAGDPVTPVSIELEPGELFAVGEFSDLTELCKALEKEKELGDWVGVNLDIAHWRIMGIVPSDVKNEESIYRRIVHSHISGHYIKSHCADIGFRRYNVPTEFREWIELISTLESDRGIRYSGLLSLEMEACQGVGLDEAFSDAAALVEAYA